MIEGAPNNVRDFGAKGDGTTDDSTAIQAALDLKGQVYIPSGTYLINTTLKIKSNTKLYGDGIEATILKEGGAGRLFIPSHLAYGANPPNGRIPANAVLAFDIELFEVR